MNTVNPQIAAKSGEGYRKTAFRFEDLGLDTQVPEVVRTVAEKTVALRARSMNIPNMLLRPQ